MRVERERMKKQFKVMKFTYNGYFVMGCDPKKLTDYTAEFVEWTKDPGVAVFKCSDKKERRIPTCAILMSKEEFAEKPFSLQTYENGKEIFGKSSSSD